MGKKCGQNKGIDGRSCSPFYPETRVLASFEVIARSQSLDTQARGAGIVPRRSLLAASHDSNSPQLETFAAQTVAAIVNSFLDEGHVRSPTKPNGRRG